MKSEEPPSALTRGAPPVSCSSNRVQNFWLSFPSPQFAKTLGTKY